jgi:hypothetical protein
MKRTFKRRTLVMLGVGLLLGLMAISFTAAAQNDFQLLWFSIDGGAGSSQGDSFSLSGIIGQPDASQLSGGHYSLGGGFWAAPPASPPGAQRVYLPLVGLNTNP